MIQRSRRKIVLYQPKQVDETLGLESAKDMLPLELLTIAAYPVSEGYEVEIIDGGLYAGDTGHRRLVEACTDAMMVATTGILGYMVNDGYQAITKVKAAHPSISAVIGGWFASVRPDLQLATGLYDCVVLGQGEHTFRDVVEAVASAEPLDGVAGLALMRDGEVVRTEKRAVVGWNQILPIPWDLIDIAPYREHQLRPGSARDVLRMPSPGPIGENKPYFGITYFGSYGCPEPCSFCCSPLVTDRRWKPVPADRMLDDLASLKDRWGFDVVRFHDANFGVKEKRVREFSEGLLARDMKLHWNAFMETHSILNYAPKTLDLMADSGMYIAEIGAETGTNETMARVGKPIKDDDNVRAVVEMDKRGIQGSVTYIIGFPGESEASMLATIDQCRHMHNAAPRSRPTVWPYRPIPGTEMWDQAIALGYKSPTTLPEWGSIGEYHLEETWPGKIPPSVAKARMMYQHYATLNWGLASPKRGFWEGRAKKRLQNGSYIHGRWEAKAFSVYSRLRRTFTSVADKPRSWVDPGHRTGTSGNERSDAKSVMTGATRG